MFSLFKKWRSKKELSAEQAAALSIVEQTVKQPESLPETATDTPTKTNKEKYQPTKDAIYANARGTVFGGELWVYVESGDRFHGFYSFNTKQNRIVPIEKYMVGIDNGFIIEDAEESIPPDIRKWCEAQFKYNLVNKPNTNQEPEQEPKFEN